MSDVEILHYLKKNLGIIIKRLEESGVLTIPYTGKIICLENRTVPPNEWLTILEHTGIGRIDEFFIRSPETSFTVQVSVDGAVVLEKTYDELREIQQNSRDVSAFAELDENGDPTGYYIVSIRNIPYYSSVSVKLQNVGAASITLPNIFVKYRILGGM